MIRGDAPHPRLELRRGPKPHPLGSWAGEHDPAAPLRHRPHQGARARRRRNHAPSCQESAPPPRLPENDRQRRPPASARLTAPPGRVRRLAPNPRHTRGKRHASMTTQAPVTPRRIVIARKNGDRIRRRASTTGPNKAVGSCFIAAIQRQRSERICRRRTPRVISRYGARPESTAGAVRIRPDRADWYRSWSARDAVKAPLRGS